MTRLATKQTAACLIMLSGIGCNDPAPRPQPPPPPSPPSAPAGQVSAVPPGQYTNHVGNPAVGYWGPNGQWVWKDPNSPQANETWKYLAAAGVGAAGGAALTYALSRKRFQKEHPGGWSPSGATMAVDTYRDKRGNPISKSEFERRRAQSERDRAKHRAALQSSQKGSEGRYQDKRGQPISKAEYQRRQAQSARDRAKARSTSRNSRSRQWSRSRSRFRSRRR